ncbi:MAG: ATP-binding protein [Planctomycetes bacterium]|nr:ATP-binding protein [Planctomycetota bacterium]
MKIHRHYDQLEAYSQPGKVLMIYGPRQVGKTTLVKQYLESGGHGRYRFDTGDNAKTQGYFASRNLDDLLAYTEGYDLLVIDEAQRIPHVGIGLKMLVDHRPDIHIIATGSSSSTLAGEVGEPLTGRKRTLTLYPVAQLELLAEHPPIELRERLEEYLIFGSYPTVLTTSGHQAKASLLEELAHSYLLKDILELERVKGAKILLDLLRLLAFQIGSEVSLSELGRQLQLDTKTVARYLDLFERSFVLFNVRGFSRNLRKEVTKKSKYYFYDNGIRNALIANFNGLSLRNDAGQLWENFIFMERLKKRSYTSIPANIYFWRTWDQQEVDIVEEREGNLFGYECKWNPRKAPAPPKDWIRQYPNATFKVITQTEYLSFIT